MGTDETQIHIMSYHVFFGFSQGLARSLRVPKGFKARCLAHVLEVEKKLGLTRTKYLDNPVHWDGFKSNFRQIDDQVLCETISQHNRWVRECYEEIGFWAEHPFTVGKGPQDEGPNRSWPAGHGSEALSPAVAAKFWHGFVTLTVPIDQWTREYYVERMEHFYEVMRGRASEGVSFDVPKLTERQAAEVINIFSVYLDSNDMRLEVPRGRDHLASSYDGGYDWCEKCGCAVSIDDQGCGKSKCPVRAEYGE